MSIYTRTYSKKKAQAKAKEVEIEKLYERAFKGLSRRPPRKKSQA